MQRFTFCVPCRKSAQTPACMLREEKEKKNPLDGRGRRKHPLAASSAIFFFLLPYNVCPNCHCDWPCTVLLSNVLHDMSSTPTCIKIREASSLPSTCFSSLIRLRMCIAFFLYAESRVYCAMPEHVKEPPGGRNFQRPLL